MDNELKLEKDDVRYFLEKALRSLDTSNPNNFIKPLRQAEVSIAQYLVNLEESRK